MNAERYPADSEKGNLAISLLLVAVIALTVRKSDRAPGIVIPPEAAPAKPAPEK